MEGLVGNLPAGLGLEQHEVVDEGDGTVHQGDLGAGRRAADVDGVDAAAARGLVGGGLALEAGAVGFDVPGGQRAFAHAFDAGGGDRKSTRLNSSHLVISYAVFCLKKKRKRLYAAALRVEANRELPVLALVLSARVRVA